MKCPTDQATLVMSERSGVEIDYCPECRGVWLDRGELDKIIDRVAAENPPAPAPTAPQTPAPTREPYREPARDDFRRDDRRDDDYRGRDQYPYRKKKKEHWLSELFD